MKNYTFEVSEDFSPQIFKITLDAATPQDAEKEVREIYAEDLGTTEDQLIVKLIKVE